MKIAIVDDEEKWLIKVEKYVREYLKEIPLDIFCFLSAEDFLESGEEYSIIFMDIELKGINGFNALELYRGNHDKSLFLILTTHLEMSRKGYKVNAFRYIDKMHLEEIDEALESSILYFHRYKKVEICIQPKKYKKFSLYDILYFYVYGHEMTIHFSNGMSERCGETMVELTEKLKQDGFLLINRSQLVNIEHIHMVTKEGITLDTNENLPLSRRKYMEVRQKFFKWKMKTI